MSEILTDKQNTYYITFGVFGNEIVINLPWNYLKLKFKTPSVNSNFVLLYIILSATLPIGLLGQLRWWAFDSLTKNYEKLYCKREPYRFSGPLIQTDTDRSSYFYRKLIYEFG